ncbi:MAG: hypothetical protein JRD68_00170 [Deltaproteobacteria bacterium]|nr:hypothetical protein [Deltaproteobacteria bacterium]
MMKEEALKKDKRYTILYHEEETFDLFDCAESPDGPWLYDPDMDLEAALEKIDFLEARVADLATALEEKKKENRELAQVLENSKQAHTESYERLSRNVETLEKQNEKLDAALESTRRQIILQAKLHAVEK